MGAGPPLIFLWPWAAPSRGPSAAQIQPAGYLPSVADALFTKGPAGRLIIQRRTTTDVQRVGQDTSRSWGAPRCAWRRRNILGDSSSSITVHIVILVSRSRGLDFCLVWVLIKVIAACPLSHTHEALRDHTLHHRWDLVYSIFQGAYFRDGLGFV